MDKDRHRVIYQKSDGKDLAMSQEVTAAKAVEYQSASPERRAILSEELLAGNENLIRHFVNKRFRSYMGGQHRDDILQEARIGFLKGLSCYDPAKAMYSTHVEPYISSEVYSYIMQMNRTTRYGQARLGAYNRTLAELAQEGNTRPQVTEVAERMGIGVEAVKSIIETKQGINPYSLDRDEILAGEACDPVKFSPEVIAEQSEKDRALRNAIDALPEDQKKVVELYWFEYNKKAFAFAGGTKNSSRRIEKLAEKLEKLEAEARGDERASELAQLAKSRTKTRLIAAERLAECAFATDDQDVAERLYEKAEELRRATENDIVCVKAAIYRAFYNGKSKEQRSFMSDPYEYDEELLAAKDIPSKLATAGDEPTLDYAAKRLKMSVEDVRKAKTRALRAIKRNEKLSGLYEGSEHGRELLSAAEKVTIIFRNSKESIDNMMKVFDMIEIDIGIE